ncbi:chalcone isomerase family protein [Vibrio xiamenensis]|nr:chalcone isomerase family protein [Vibrio xiamenensis]
MAILGAVKKPAFASTVSQAKANPSQHNEWRAWQKVGQARLSIFWFDIYDSVLYSPSGQVANWPQITHQPTALSITYLRDISATDFINATEEQWQKLGFSQAQITPWISKLEGIFPNVAEGDSLTYVSHNQRGEFWFASNSASNLIGEIDDMELNQAFLAIWLSPSTSYPKLRAQLLGETR